ncbi:MAG: hypothetical protein AB8I08_27045 [Sandaracinaceae bacterium]
MERGYITLFRLRGVPLRAHWSVPLGVLVFSGMRFAPGIWLGMLSLILLHELGHAALVSRAGLVNLGIDVTGFGGRCRWAGNPTPRERAAIAWGGVLAQLGVLAVAAPFWWLWGDSRGFLGDLLYALTSLNLFLIALNLVPFPPLDGAEAWPWFKLARDDRARKKKWKDKLGSAPRRDPKAAPQTLREALDEADRNR